MHFVKYHQLWLTSNVSTSCKVRFIKHTRLLVLVLEILYLPLTDRTHSPRYLYIKSLNPSLASLASEFTSMTCFFKFKEIWTLQTTQNPRNLLKALKKKPSRVESVITSRVILHYRYGTISFTIFLVNIVQFVQFWSQN